MAKKWQKVTAGVLTGVLAASALAIAPGCGDTLVVNIDPVEGINYTYRTYTAVSPSNWNELTYQDNNDTQIMSYISSPFFEFDFNFEDGKVIDDGSFQMKYSAATKLEDVTDVYEDTWYKDQDVSAGGYAWKITLRDDLMWDDGTPIYAQDFVYSAKQALDPLFKNYRADSYYSGNYVFRNAKEYAYQGSIGNFDATMVYDSYEASLDSKLYFSIGNGSEEWTDGSTAAWRTVYGMPESYTLEKAAAWLKANSLPDAGQGKEPNGNEGYTVEKYMSLDGKTLAEIKANTELNFIYEAIMGFWTADVGGRYDLYWCLAEKAWPKVDFADVGIFSLGTYELVIILDTPLALVDDKGDLTYEAGYYFSSLPLVKQSLYEACKVAPVEGSTLWTSKYCSSKETTASWGPYMLYKFQAGRYYELRRNPNWYGYKDYDEDGKSDLYPDQYQTERIVCDTVASWNTAWQMFRKGGVDGIGIDVTIADDYKDSSRAYFTASDFVGSIQVQSSILANNKVSESRDNRMLSIQKFRHAMSLALDRADYAATCTTASLAGFGYFNSMHYYDVANGKTYRSSDYAKEVLLRTYGWVEDTTDGKWSIDGGDKYELDEAVDRITGYNLELAKDLVDEAYDEAVEELGWTDNDKVILVYGSSEETESDKRIYNYLKNTWTTMVEGTKLEGKFELKYDATYGTQWANDFRDGAYDICTGGWSGAAWNPYFFIGAYILDQYRYAYGWNPNAQSFEFTYFNGTENVTETKSVMEWYNILNLSDDNKVAQKWDEDQKLRLLANLEEQVLNTFYAIPAFNSFSASLMTYKCDYITYEYNTFVGYGGIQYMTYNYTDAEWKAYVTQQGTLNYKG